MKNLKDKLLLSIKYLFNLPVTLNHLEIKKDKDSTLQKILQENLYANYFHDSIKNSSWLKNQNFTPTKGAANYSFLFTLFSILENTNVANILELGLGQTSKITTQYINNKNTCANLTILEHNQDWVQTFSKNLVLSENIQILTPKLCTTNIKGYSATKYENILPSESKYDLIIIDGPIGIDQTYSRSNILDLVPNNLAKDFIIVFDDYERIGEQNTANLLFEKLNKNFINYQTSMQYGMKKQLIISSPSYQYIHWI